MSIADTMATNGMKEAGYEYINLDGTCADTFFNVFFFCKCVG